jgi:hypothetical protein
MAPNGELITNRTKIAKCLMENLFPNDEPENDNERQRQTRIRSELEYNENNNDLDFHEHEVTAVVMAQNHKKSPGEDSFTADIIKRLHNIEPTFLTKLYNKCLQLSYFPTQWKSSVVKVIKKAGNRDYSLPNSYRSISLLSIFAKILEKMLINRIVRFINSNNGLSDEQYGFTQQKST